MKLDSHAPPLYLPESDQRSVLRLGLQRLDASRWMWVDADLPVFHRHKLRQGQIRPRTVCDALPGTEAGIRELNACLLEHLLRDYQTEYRRDQHGLHHLPSGLSWPIDLGDLWQCSLWVPEDLCLMQERDGQFRLVAASVCSPSDWQLPDKLGRSLNGIHAPVPDYATSLGSRVQRLFSSLKPSKSLLRYNWSLQPGNELYWQSETDAPDGDGTDYWRVERQTLRRLPESGIIVFGIRIFLYSVSLLQEQKPDFDRQLRSLISGLPAAERRYKGLI